MEPDSHDRDLASWAYYVSFASLGLGLPIPFLSLAAGTAFLLVQRRRSPFVAFHAWQALLLGLPASLVTGVWSCWGLGVLFEYFLTAGHVTADLTGFWVLGLACALLLTEEVVLGLRGAASAQRGALEGFAPLVPLCRQLAFREPKPRP